MRSILLIPFILFISCGKSNEAIQQLQSHAPFSVTTLTDQEVQCESIKTNFLKADITCPTSFVSEEKLFLLSVPQEEVMTESLLKPSRLTLRISSKGNFQGYFYIVSKYGKVLSEEVFYDGKSEMIFKELRSGDFISHDLHLKLKDYYTGGTTSTAVALERDQSCDTGVFNVEEINLEDLQGTCPSLKVIPNLSAKVLAPVYFENKDFDMTDVNPIILNFGGYGSAQYRINYRVLKYMQERDMDYSRFFNVEATEFGLRSSLISREVCEIEGILAIQGPGINGGWADQNYELIKKQPFGNIVIRGKHHPFHGNYRVEKCYPVEPKLSGTIIIKE